MKRQGNGLLVAAIALVALALWLPDSQPGRSVAAPVDADLGLGAAVLGFELLNPTPSPAPTPQPQPDEPAKHSRAECPTGGWIEQGDRHRTRCPDCDPPYAADEPAEPSPEPIEQPKPTIETPAVAESIVQPLGASVVPLAFASIDSGWQDPLCVDGSCELPMSGGGVCVDGSCSAATSSSGASTSSGSGRILSGERFPRVKKVIQRAWRPVQRVLGRRGCRGC